MSRLVDQLWSSFRSDVQEARELDAEAIDDLVANFVELVQAEDGSVADVVQKRGFVDELLTREEVQNRVVEYAGVDPESVDLYNAAALEDYLKQMRLMRGKPAADDNIAVIVAAGEILDGDQPPGTIGGDSTARLLREARQDETVRAVVLRVDSPGGSAFASDIIRNEILSLRDAGKPVVASMAGVAASGGYWISMAADRIYASPSTITGSIGIFGMFPTFQRSLDSLGISTDGIGTTQWAGELRPDRAMSEDARDLFQTMIDDGYDDFISRVAFHRDMDKAAVDEVAQGQVWTGAEALEFGLIDSLGSLDDAIAAAAELAGLQADEYGEKYFEPELTPAEQLALQLLASVRSVGLDVKSVFLQRSAVERLAGAMLDRLSPLLRFNDPKGVYAHCFCALE
jgi:protease-4